MAPSGSKGKGQRAGKTLSDAQGTDVGAPEEDGLDAQYWSDANIMALPYLDSNESVRQNKSRKVSQIKRGSLRILDCTSPLLYIGGPSSPRDPAPKGRELGGPTGPFVWLELLPELNSDA